MLREFMRVPELRIGVLVLGALFARQALFGEAALRLKSEVILGRGASLSELFENPGLLSGKAIHQRLDLPPGYQYLDKDEIQYRLGKAVPALAAVPLDGDGVKVYTRVGDVKDPLAGRPPALPEAPLVDAPAKSSESRYLFLLPREWEGRAFIPKGTAVILGRDGGRVTIQLKGRLVKDFDFQGSMKVKLLHTGGIVEEPVGRGDLVYF
ncbi:MAG: hypothetical protein J0L75_19820 [Spirochaetes bacterium]|nr:hypothetical protein [Spirochaetota bacterium]